MSGFEILSYKVTDITIQQNNIYNVYKCDKTKTDSKSSVKKDSKITKKCGLCELRTSPKKNYILKFHKLYVWNLKVKKKASNSNSKLFVFYNMVFIFVIINLNS